MDLREYYRKIHEKEQEIAEPFVTVVSLKNARWRGDRDERRSCPGR